MVDIAGPRSGPGPLDADKDRKPAKKISLLFADDAAQSTLCAAVSLITPAILRTDAGLNAPIGVVVARS
ncbi:hypothetical protein L2331_14080 [Mesorhizobium muleiense]|nr:hypothetical protein [Mesorhizobium muleiense]